MLEIRPSQIPGAGLGAYATERIAKGCVIADYRAQTEKLTPAEFLQRYPSGRATHALYVPRERMYYDGLHSRAAITRANRAPRGKRNHATFRGPKVVATRTVPAGEELLLAYGAGFRV